MWHINEAFAKVKEFWQSIRVDVFAAVALHAILTNDYKDRDYAEIPADAYKYAKAIVWESKKQ